MKVQSRWGRAETPEDTGWEERIEDVGLPVPLAAAIDEERALQNELLATLVEETELEDAGAACKVKSYLDASCHACPLYRPDDTPNGRLCQLGRRQDELTTRLRIIRAGGR